MADGEWSEKVTLLLKSLVSIFCIYFCIYAFIQQWNIQLTKINIKDMLENIYL